MKMVFGSRPVREDCDALETIEVSGNTRSGLAGSAGKPCRADAPARMVAPGVYLRGERRRVVVPGPLPFDGPSLARAVFGAAGVTEGDWTWTVTSTRQTFWAWRTA